MALTANKETITVRPDMLKPVRNMNVASATEIFAGAMVVVDGSGDAINAPATGALLWMGFARNFVNNTGAATTDTPLLVEKGAVEQLTMDSGPSDVDLGKPVYYTDDDEISLTIVPSTGVAGSQVGVLHSIVSGTTVLVDTQKSIT